jgi:hypothetical protein
MRRYDCRRLQLRHWRSTDKMIRQWAATMILDELRISQCAQTLTKTAPTSWPMHVA